MYDDPKKSADYSNDVTPQVNNNNDMTQVDEPNKMNERAFNYLEIDNNNPEKFIYEGDEKTNNFQNNKDKYNYIICVLLKDDSSQSSILLEKTLDGIYQNLRSTQDLGISSANTLVCIFVKQINYYSLFHKDELEKMKTNQSFFLCVSARKTNNPSSTLCLFTKPRELKDIEALKCYYLGVIPQIRSEKKPIFSSVITAGVEPNSLNKLILLSYNNVKKHGAAVGVIESNGYGVFSMIEQYERTHFNIYNMNFYDICSAVPVSSLLSTIYIDDKIYSTLKDFYSFRNSNKNQTIDYHDYYLGIYLNQNNASVNFYSSESSGVLHENELEYCDYQEIWVNRYSGYYGNFFNLLGDFKNCNDFYKKIFLFFQIIGFLIEFIYPSLSSMVIYSIFYEAFGIYDYRCATFLTMLYISMLLASGMSSLVTKKPQEMKMTNFFLFIFMEVYYLLVLICSVIAMDNVKKNKTNNEYKFNNAAISCIIVFTLVPYILPMLLRLGPISSNFFNMLIYIGLGAPSSTSNFLMAQIWNASDTSGGNEIDERKSVVLIAFFLSNLFFGSLTFFNYTRRKRVVCIMGFGIFYLIYNFFKVMGIICNILGSNDEPIDPKKNGQIIESIKNALGKFDENDMRSEEKQLKNYNFYNNENNNVNDFNNNETNGDNNNEYDGNNPYNNNDNDNYYNNNDDYN